MLIRGGARWTAIAGTVIASLTICGVSGMSQVLEERAGRLVGPYLSRVVATRRTATRRRPPDPSARPACRGCARAVRRYSQGVCQQQDGRR